MNCQETRLVTVEILMFTDFTARKIELSIQDSFSKCDALFNGKLHFLCSVWSI